MADYTVQEYEEKRLRYFNGQFLEEQDFIDEQVYHINRQRLHSLLHTWGIVDGLIVTADVEATEAVVSPGVAVDGDGRQIVLSSSRTVSLSGFASQMVLLVISYYEESSNPASVGGTGDTRWHERPRVEAVAEADDPPDDTYLRLAKLGVDGYGKVSVHHTDVRVSAGVRLGDEVEMRKLTLSREGVGPSEWPALTCGAAGQADVEGNLKVDGIIQVTGTVDGRDVSVDGGTLDNHVARTNNPHAVSAAQVGALASVDGVSNPGGDVDLVPKNAITIAPNDHSNQITISENHSARKNNPHNVSAAQVKALASVDGVSNPGSNVDLVPKNAITITPDDTNKEIAIGENHSTRTDNPHGTTAADVGALPTTGGTVNGSIHAYRSYTPPPPGMIHLFPVYALRAYVIPDPPPPPTPTPFTVKAAAMGISKVPGVFGVYAEAASGTHALHVSGTARFTGAKTGYVVDAFVNASGQALRTGDVVKLKGTPIPRFQGDDNKIPVAEITLANAENDSTVIGIVDRESIPEQGVPDRRVDPDDPTSIEDGGELFVVTLGTYAHCKVDATEVPIGVGDLLTTSSNPGFAKKATDPKIGTIIGKALEPLKEGTGYIAVFVNIQ